MSTLFEGILALSIATYGIVQADQAAIRATQVNVAVQTGQYMYGLQQAVNKFIAVNGDQLSGRTAASYTDAYGNPITIANPNAPTMTELMNGKFLPVGWSTNAPAQGMTFKIAVSPTNCPGAGCQLPAYITSTPYRDGAGNIRNDLMAYAVSKAGLDGGLSPTSNPGTFTSLGKTWSEPNATGQAGSLMMRAGVLTTGYVDTLPFYKTDGSRALTGTMNANGNAINNAGNITSKGNISAQGDVAASTMHASTIQTGGLSANTVSANSVALPAGNSLTISGTQWYGDTQNAAIRVPGALYLQGPNGSGWASLNAGSAGFTGNVNVTGQATANTMVANGITSWGNIAASAQVSANTVVANGITSNGDSYTAGNNTVNGVFTARNVVHLPALAYDGWGCSGNGVTTDPSGNILACKSGVWREVTVNNYVTNNYPTTYVTQTVQPAGRYVTDVNASNAQCGGWTTHYSDGTYQNYLSWAGCGTGR